MLEALLFDNPILVKHLRARLRRQQLLPWCIIVLVLAACIAGSGLAHTRATETAEEVSNAYAFALIWLLVLQGAILFLIGAAQVAGSVMQARESGLIDFHRVSPQSPVALSLGFLLGAPVREYLLFACVMPFSLLIVLIDGDLARIGGLLLAWLAMLAASLFFNAAALFFGLVLPKGRGVGALIVVLVIALHLGFMVSPFISFLTVVPAIAAHLLASFDEIQSGMPLFFGLPLPAVLIGLLHQLPLAGFLFAAAARKMRREPAFAFSRKAALGCFLTLAVLLLGDVVVYSGFLEAGSGDAEYSGISLLYSLLGIGALLVTAVTPTAGEFVKGMRHARKLGRRRPSRWDDLAANWTPVLGFAVIISLAGLSLELAQSETWSDSGWGMVSAALTAAAVLAVFGLGRQAFAFRYRKHGQLYFGLALFAVWIVPLLLGVVAIMAGAADPLPETLMRLSPLAGIGQLIVDRGTDTLLTVWVTLAELLAALWLHQVSLRAMLSEAAAAEKPVEPPLLPSVVAG